MRVIIPYKQAGQELKYCLRGIEKYIDNPEVTVIGDKPNLKVDHISFKNARDLNFKAKNIYDKIMSVKEDFMFFNDDHSLLAPFGKDDYYYSGTLKEKLEKNESPTFEKTLLNTYALAGDIKYFDVHCPIYYQAGKLKFTVDWNKPGGYCLKSLYCFCNNIEGTSYPDLKICKTLQADKIRELIKGRKWFSTANQAMGKDMIQVLEECYPFKSVYE